VGKMKMKMEMSNTFFLEFCLTHHSRNVVIKAGNYFNVLGMKVNNVSKLGLDVMLYPFISLLCVTTMRLGMLFHSKKKRKITFPF